MTQAPAGFLLEGNSEMWFGDFIFTWDHEPAFWFQESRSILTNTSHDSLLQYGVWVFVN